MDTEERRRRRRRRDSTCGIHAQFMFVLQKIQESCKRRRKTEEDRLHRTQRLNGQLDLGWFVRWSKTRIVGSKLCCGHFTLWLCMRKVRSSERKVQDRKHTHLKRNLFFQRRGIWIDSAKEPKSNGRKDGREEQTKKDKAENRNLVDLPRIHTWGRRL